MAGRGPAPKPPEARRTRHVPIRGDWQPAPGAGWQHGSIPKPPTGLMPESRAVWQTWFHAWWASYWTPEYLPQIRLAIHLYDEFIRGEVRVATELRQAMDGIGASFKGQQDRRWAGPKPDEAPKVAPSDDDPYKGLTVVPKTA